MDRDGGYTDANGVAHDGINLGYFGGRYLDNVVGMWISRDKAEQYVNPYRYTLNPIGFIDPDGNYDLSALNDNDRASMNSVISSLPKHKNYSDANDLIKFLSQDKQSLQSMSVDGHGPKIIVTSFLFKNVAGLYLGGANLLIMNRNRMSDPSMIRSTLLHETAHAATFDSKGMRSSIDFSNSKENGILYQALFSRFTNAAKMDGSGEGYLMNSMMGENVGQYRPQ